MTPRKMSRVLTIAVLLAGFASPWLPAALRAEKEEGFRSMFNGKDLSGWDGAPGWWEVKDGVLFAESTLEKPCKRSHYLVWNEFEPSDFDLRFEFRVSGEANSGVQFRSERRPNFDTWGYQADLDTAGVYTGCLYQHVRGLVAQRGQKVRIDKAGVKTVSEIGDPAQLLEAVKSGEWNVYRVVAKGPNILLWINNVKMCEVEDYQEKFALPKGIIALQMHQGPPMKAEFRNIRIRMKKD